jgi:hypothetical protein
MRKRSRAVLAIARRRPEMPASQTLYSAAPIIATRSGLGMGALPAYSSRQEAAMRASLFVVEIEEHLISLQALAIQ